MFIPPDFITLLATSITYCIWHGWSICAYLSRRLLFLYCLLHGILYRLVRVMVLQLHRHDRQAVQGDIQINTVAVGSAVEELPCHTEDVAPVHFLCARVQFRWSGIINVKCLRDVLVALAQHVCYTAFANFITEACKEIPFRGSIGKASRVFHFLLLGGEDKPLYTLGVNTKLLVVAI